MDKEVSKYMAEIGRRGGKKRSPAQIAHTQKLIELKKKAKRERT